MRKLIALICAIAIIASMGIVAAFAAEVNDFYDDGIKYDITFHYNTDTATIYGGMDGISDKTPPVDAVIHYRGCIGFASDYVSRIGYVLNYGEEDEQEPVWIEANLADGMEATESIGQSDVNSILGGAYGDYPTTYTFDLDISTFAPGTYNLAIVAECDGSIYEIGTRTESYAQQQGGSMFKTKAISTGANYDPNAATAEPVATEEAEATEEAPVTAEVTEEPTEAPTEEPTEAPTEAPVITEAPTEDPLIDEPIPTSSSAAKKGCKSVVAGSAVLVLAAASFVAFKKKEI